MAKKGRMERDTMGAIEVPADRLWGAQTQRSLHHFHFPGETMPLDVVRAQVLVKKAAALVNVALGVLDKRKGAAIVKAADEALAGGLDDHFPLVTWQTGSGTQTNMNVNEVLANRASELLGGSRGDYLRLSGRALGGAAQLHEHALHLVGLHGVTSREFDHAGGQAGGRFAGFDDAFHLAHPAPGRRRDVAQLAAHAVEQLGRGVDDTAGFGGGARSLRGLTSRLFGEAADFIGNHGEA